MLFSEDDKALIKNLHLFKGSRTLLAEFPTKNSTTMLKKKLKETEELTELNITINSVFAPELANNWNMMVSQGSAAIKVC